MSVYSSIQTYPSIFDEIDEFQYEYCEYCNFDCDIHGYCINRGKNNE